MRCVAALILTLFVALNASAERYVAGAAALTINPSDGMFLAGYGRDRRVDGRWDDLFAKALYLDDGIAPVAVVTLDSIGLTRPDVLLIQSAAAERVEGLQPERVVVSSTHTHAAPDVVGLWGEHLFTSGRNPDYMKRLIDRAAAAVQEAHRSASAVQVRLASKDLALDWVENLSEPALLDSRLSVLQLVDEFGRSVATLTNYACHPTVLGPQNTRFSSDYLAAFYEQMANALPGEHLFLQGAIGGWVQPLQGDRSVERAADIGRSLAAASLETLGDAQPGAYRPINFRHTTFDVPLSNWGFRLMMWLGVLERQPRDGAMRTSTAVFDISDARFATHPGETSPYYAFETRKLLGTRHTFVMGLSQDAIGYILKPEYFEDGAAYPHADYLVSVSVGPEAGPRLMEAIEGLLQP